MRTTTLLLLLASACFLHAQAPAPAVKKADAPKPKAYADPAQTDEDFKFQGEYVGLWKGDPRGVQIWAQGGGKFEAVTYNGGLPGDGWVGPQAAPANHFSGALDAGRGVVVFKSDGCLADADGHKISVRNESDNAPMTTLVLKERVSPTMGAKPPADAVVLFGGKDANKFPNSKVTEDGLLMEGATSADKFKDFSIHVEFRLAYMPTSRGQGRSNSGVYLQGRYEIQVLDSFALEGKNNECGGIYTIATPKVNMCLPPLTWQTYDADFTAAKYDAEGKKTANARVSVKHNGVLIHDNVEIPHTTQSGPISTETDTPGPIYLQNHGNPVRFRNVWVVEKK